MLLRFRWLVKKDFSSFGINFQTYVIVSMTISFVTMVLAIRKYANRFRANLRSTASLRTVLEIVFLTSLVLTKLCVYIIGFLNTPGFFFVPMIVHIALALILLNIFEPNFNSMPNHDKLVYLLISSLVPVSIPVEKKTALPIHYLISLVLFFLECFAILAFAFFMKTYYHFNSFKNFYKGFQNLIKVSYAVTNFDELLFLCVICVLGVTLIASFLLIVQSTACHPKALLFKNMGSRFTDLKDKQNIDMLEESTEEDESEIDQEFNDEIIVQARDSDAHRA